MSDKLISSAGLAHFWSNCKSFFASKSHTHDNATTSASGFMSSDDKTKLNGIETGANKTTVDTSLSSTSTNPVQNKVIYTELSNKASSTHNHNSMYSKLPSQLSDGTLSDTVIITFTNGSTEAKCTMADLVNYLTEALNLSSYATTNQLSAYLTKSSASNTYLAKTGGTIDGNLTITGNLRVEGDSTLNGQ